MTLDLTDLAFNRGCDDRLRGIALSSNPYAKFEPTYSSWRRGWLSVQNTWGVDALAKGRDVRPLPKVG
jgi:hypothetical protein